MAKDNKALTFDMQRLGWEIHEAQLVMTSQNDITCVCAWLSKDGTFYFSGGLKHPNLVEKALKEAGYHVVERFKS